MRIFGKALALFAVIFGPALLYALFIATSLFLYNLGDCEGALGSGVKCARGDSFGTMAVQAELSLLMAIPALVIIWAIVSAIAIALIWFVGLITKPFRRPRAA